MYIFSSDSEGLPADFSLMATFRQSNRSTTDGKLSIPLLTIYNDEARQVFGLYVGENAMFLLSDEEARTTLDKATPFESWNTNDGK
jgi:hypothetical protein